MEFILIRDKVHREILKQGSLDSVVDYLNQIRTKFNISEVNTKISKNRISKFRKNASKAIKRGRIVFFLYLESGDVYTIEAIKKGEKFDE